MCFNRYRPHGSGLRGIIHEWARLAADELVLGGSHLWQATVASGWTLLAAGHDGCPSVLVKIVGKLVQEATRQAVTGVTRLSS